MTYKEAMDLAKDGKHLSRHRMVLFDFYILWNVDKFVKVTYEGYITDDYIPLEEDLIATDWDVI